MSPAMSLPHTSNHSGDTYEARCPSCEQHTQFRYGGEQHWPLRVSQATGLPRTVTLWHCSNCQSTFCENDLR